MTNRQRALLAGLASSQIARAAWVPLSALPVIFVVWLAVGMLSDVNAPGGARTMYFTLMLAMAGVLVGVLGILAVAEQKRFREARAGYTVIPGSEHLELVEPRSGVVVREAGMPPLSASELRARREAIKLEGLSRLPSLPSDRKEHVVALPGDAAPRTSSASSVSPTATIKAPARGIPDSRRRLIPWLPVATIACIVAAVIGWMVGASSDTGRAGLSGLWLALGAVFGTFAIFAAFLSVQRWGFASQRAKYSAGVGVTAVETVWIPPGTLAGTASPVRAVRNGTWATLILTGDQVELYVGAAKRRTLIGSLTRPSVGDVSVVDGIEVNGAHQGSPGVRVELHEAPSVYLGAAGTRFSAPYSATRADAERLRHVIGRADQP